MFGLLLQYMETIANLLLLYVYHERAAPVIFFNIGYDIFITNMQAH